MTNDSAPNGLEKRGLDLYKNPLTQQDVEIIVERSFGPNYKIHNYSVKSYSNENLGFMGAHRNFVVQVSQEGSTVKELNTYFLKSVPYNINGQAKFVEDSKMFYKETSFYNLIMPELMKSSKDKSWAPQCYLVKDDAIVFENLILKNYTLSEKYLNLPCLEGALASLAKLHAASILAEKRLGKTFLELYPELMDEVLFSADGPFGVWNERGIDAVVAIAKYLGLDYKIVPKVCHLIYDKILPSKTRRNVINHGDAWSNNLMFNGTKCALVDFQLIRYVPAMTDVALLIYHNSKKELRDEHEMDLLRHYHKVMCDTLKDGGETILPKFEDIVEEYEETRIIATIKINLYFQINKINGKKQVELMSTTEGFNSLLYEDRVPLVLDLMESDELYRDALSSAVRELIDIAPKYVM